MRRFLVTAGTVLALGGVSATGALAADPHNQNGSTSTGQPSQSCEEQPSGPAGFDTAGFAHAQTVYANVDGTHMVSQYDVACYQLSH